jgi:hypothetical protein
LFRLDSLAEAETYCETKVEQISNLPCDIYDQTGKSKPPTLTYVNKAYLKSPQKHAYLGWVLLAIGIGMEQSFLWSWEST